MANEITVSLSVLVAKDNLNWKFAPGQKQYDLTTARRGGHVQTIGETPELLDVGDVAAASLCVLRNTSATYNVEVGPQNGTTSQMEPDQSIPPGRFSLLWLDSTASLMAMGVGGSVDLEVNIFEA